MKAKINAAILKTLLNALNFVSFAFFAVDSYQAWEQLADFQKINLYIWDAPN
ncbi:hypothetical protein [Sphaerospermopsis aphanizomenoides]|uniref:hypothetical protein n=1 Tax=Sphaerospermopsis aphanizomenoides TaxID=459663 RepID=UPI0019036E77|nr:hypothetical protein [Sphaerospermopsis aphanizomenoides]